MIKQTSLDAYIDIKSNGNIQEQQKKILLKMTLGYNYTRRELAALTKLETSTVSARVNAMLDTFIEVMGKRKCRISGKTVESLTLMAG